MGFGREPLAETVILAKLVDVKINKTPYFQQREKQGDEWKEVPLATDTEKRKNQFVEGILHDISESNYEYEGETIYGFKITLKDQENGKDEAYILDFNLNNLGRRALNQLMDSGAQKGDRLSISVWLERDPYNDKGDCAQGISLKLNGETLKSKYSNDDLNNMDLIGTDTVKGKKVRNFDKVDKMFMEEELPKIISVLNGDVREGAESMKYETQAAKKKAEKESAPKEPVEVEAGEDADDLPF